MADLNPNLILLQRPLPSPQDMTSERQLRQVQQQELTLRAQEIAQRGEALRQQAMQGSQKIASTDVDPKKQMEAAQYQIFQAEQVADTLKRVQANPDLYPLAKQHIGQIFGPDVAAHLPDTYDPDQVNAMIATGEKAVAQAKANLVPVDTVNAAGVNVRTFVTPREGLEVPLAQKPTAAEKAPNVGTFEDYILRTYGKDPTSAQILEGRKKFNQSDDHPPRITVNTPLATGAGGYTPEGIEYAATRARITGQYSSRNAQVIAGIDNEIAKQNKILGQSPAATIQKQAAYKGDSAALTDITKRAASAEAFEAKALGQIPIIQELSAKVPRTSMPIINSALQSGRTEITGDTNATQLANAIETFTEEYAKIMGGSTGSAAGATDSSRAAAKRLLNTAMSKGTMADVLSLMQREMALTMQGYDATKAHISERMGGGQLTAPAPAASAAPAAPAAAAGRMRVIGPSGQTGTVPAGAVLPQGWRQQ